MKKTFISRMGGKFRARRPVIFAPSVNRCLIFDLILNTVYKKN